MEERIGDYRLLKRLGVGGMGDVYLAEKAGAEGFVNHFAIKLMNPGMDKEFIEMFTAEARLAASLDHPNIARTLDYAFDQTSRRFFIVMEYINGLDLDKLAFMPGRRLPIEVSVYIIIEGLNALAYAHERAPGGQKIDLVHRDIKPSNIFVSRYAMVKILDFGIAKANVAYRKRTKAATVKGTPPYMAPEQFSVDPSTGRIEIDQRVDIYAMGLVLYEMLTGTRAYDAPTLQDLAAKIRKGQLTPIRKLNKRVARRLAQVVDLMRDIDKGKRPATARAAVSLLKEACPEWLAGKDQLVTLMEEFGSSMGAVTAEAHMALASTPAEDPRPATAVGRHALPPAAERTPLVPVLKAQTPQVPSPQPEAVPRVAPDAATQKRSLDDFRPEPVAAPNQVPAPPSRQPEPSTAKLIVADMEPLRATPKLPAPPRGTPLPAGQRVPVVADHRLAEEPSPRRAAASPLLIGLAGIGCLAVIALGIFIYKSSRRGGAEPPPVSVPRAVAADVSATDMATIAGHETLAAAEPKLPPVATPAAETAEAKAPPRQHHVHRSKPVVNSEPEQTGPVDNGTIVIGSSPNPNLRIVVDRLSVGPPPKDYSVPPGDHLVEFFDVGTHDYLTSRHVQVLPGKRVVIRVP